MCNEILMITVYITIMLRFWIYFDSEFQLINTKPIIENKLKELLNELKKLKVQIILVLHSKKKMIVKWVQQLMHTKLNILCKVERNSLPKEFSYSKIPRNKLIFSGFSCHFEFYSLEFCSERNFRDRQAKLNIWCFC